MNHPLFSKQIPVLDHGSVQLQDFMPFELIDQGADIAFVNAARTSYLGESKGVEKDFKLLRYLIDNHHTTPLEMVEFKFRIKAPIFVARQWMRYRMASFNEQSYRYTEAEENDVYIPTQWRLQDMKNKQGSSANLLDQDGADYLTRSMERLVRESFEVYREAVEDFGVAKEQARVLLHGFAVYTTFIYKVNALSLLHMLEQRMHPHAQHEFQLYARVIYNNFFKLLLPWTSEIFEEKWRAQGWF